MTANMRNVRDVSRWVEVKVDHDYTKNFQDGSLIVALGNGPKQDWACQERIKPMLS